MPAPSRFQCYFQRTLRCRYRAPCAGFTYVGVLILVAIISLISTAALQVGAVLQRRAAEEALLEIGREFRHALASYAQASAPGQKRAPSTLQELVKDPRFPTARRHLRKLYADPLTGQHEWGMEMAADGSGVIGLYSLSNAAPIKIGNFDASNADFAGKKTYRHWVFRAAP